MTLIPGTYFPLVRAALIGAAAAIIVGTIFFLAPSIPFHGFLHGLDPDPVCIYPPLTDSTADAIWEKIAERAGADPGSEIFYDIQVRLTPDETIESLSLLFFGTRNGEWRRYAAYLSYDPATCGSLMVRSMPEKNPEIPTDNPHHPREIIRELPLVRPTVFGITGQQTLVSARVNAGNNFSYYTMPCTALFILDGRSLIPADIVTIRSA